MSNLIPEGFLTLPQAANPLAVALYGGIADRDAVRLLRERGYDLADGAAFDEAVHVLWAAVERGKLQCFAVGPKGKGPLKLSAVVLQGIPVLLSPRGGTLAFLRPRNPHFKAFAEWFGPDLSNVSIVFREAEIARLARNRLQARRRKRATVGKGRTGRPSRQAQVKKVIRMDELIDLRSVQAVVVENEPADALEYLQDIYKGRRPFDPQRVRAAAIACESPKLAVVAQVADNGSFAERLERALTRSRVQPS